MNTVPKNYFQYFNLQAGKLHLKQYSEKIISKKNVAPY